jgi:hypothetical protein
MLRSHSDLSTVIIGIFSYASDARHALNTLHEHRFSADEVAGSISRAVLHRSRTRSTFSAGSQRQPVVRAAKTALPRRRSLRKRAVTAAANTAGHGRGTAPSRVFAGSHQ